MKSSKKFDNIIHYIVYIYVIFQDTFLINYIKLYQVNTTNNKTIETYIAGTILKIN